MNHLKIVLVILEFIMQDFDPGFGNNKLGTPAVLELELMIHLYNKRSASGTAKLL